MMKKTCPMLLAALCGLTLTACDVDKTQEGNVTAPEYQVSKSKEGDVTPPKYEVTPPDVDVSKEKRTVEVPDVDVKPAPDK
jgi:hypothetical protein